MEKWRVSLELDKQDKVYYAGHPVAGLARVELDQPLNIVGVEVRVVGCEWVKWSERQGIGPSYSPVEQSSQYTHIDHTIVLWGSGRKTADPPAEELSKGRHLFPFKWTLPRDLPCSFEGGEGSVRYWAQVAVLMPCCNKAPGCRTKTAADTHYFTLLNHLDLNLLKTSIGVREQRDLLVASRRMPLPAPGLCGRTGRVTAMLVLPRSAYVAGEYIQAEAHIHNMSGIAKVRRVVCSLQQIVVYRAENNHTRRAQLEVCRAIGDTVRPGRHQTWAVNNLLIPTVVPSHLANPQPGLAKHIDVTYELQLQVEVHSQTLTVSVPVTIGTMPNIESCLTLWSHTEVVPVRTKKPALPQPQSFDANSVGGLNQVHADFSPKYRTYKVAPPGAGMLTFEASPGERRRSYRLSLYPAIDESCV